MDSPRITRRTALKLGVTGGVLLAAGGGAATWFSAGYAHVLGHGDVPIALSTKEFAIVRAIVEALCPPIGTLPAGNSIGIAQRIDEEIWSADEFTRTQLKQGLQVLEHLPSFRGYGARFTSLPPTRREQFFLSMLTDRRETFRQIAVAFKQVVQLVYFANEATWASIHYDGPWVPVPRPPDSHNAYAALLREARRRA